jgi:hypothetical protein
MILPDADFVIPTGNWQVLATLKYFHHRLLV